jgi:hypothetical protein
VSYSFELMMYFWVRTKRGQRVAFLALADLGLKCWGSRAGVSPNCASTVPASFPLSPEAVLGVRGISRQEAAGQASLRSRWGSTGAGPGPEASSRCYPTLRALPFLVFGKSLASPHPKLQMNTWHTPACIFPFSCPGFPPSSSF